VLLDELCSGTNPSEAEQIITMVLDLLGDLGAEAFVTTHFLGLAERLAAASDAVGLGFLQAELDEERKPTFRFAAGVAKSSLAAETAGRLGVTRAKLDELLRRTSA
jgi:DNA mismatch repair protein MutS2